MCLCNESRALLKYAQKNPLNFFIEPKIILLEGVAHRNAMILMAFGDSFYKAAFSKDYING